MITWLEGNLSRVVMNQLRKKMKIDKKLARNLAANFLVDKYHRNIIPTKLLNAESDEDVDLVIAFEILLEALGAIHTSRTLSRTLYRIEDERGDIDIEHARVVGSYLEYLHETVTDEQVKNSINLVLGYLNDINRLSKVGK